MSGYQVLLPLDQRHYPSSCLIDFIYTVVLGTYTSHISAFATTSSVGSHGSIPTHQERDEQKIESRKQHQKTEVFTHHLMMDDGRTRTGDGQTDEKDARYGLLQLILSLTQSWL